MARHIFADRAPLRSYIRAGRLVFDGAPGLDAKLLGSESVRTPSNERAWISGTTDAPNRVIATPTSVSTQRLRTRTSAATTP